MDFYFTPFPSSQEPRPTYQIHGSLSRRRHGRPTHLVLGAVSSSAARPSRGAVHSMLSHRPLGIDTQYISFQPAQRTVRCTCRLVAALTAAQSFSNHQGPRRAFSDILTLSPALVGWDSAEVSHAHVVRPSSKHGGTQLAGQGDDDLQSSRPTCSPFTSCQARACRAVECWRGTYTREVSWAAAAGFVPEAYTGRAFPWAIPSDARGLRVRENNQLTSLDRPVGTTVRNWKSCTLWPAFAKKRRGWHQCFNHRNSAVSRMSGRVLPSRQCSAPRPTPAPAHPQSESQQRSSGAPRRQVPIILPRKLDIHPVHSAATPLPIAAR
jgi:hypothetical protein